MFYADINVKIINLSTALRIADDVILWKADNILSHADGVVESHSPESAHTCIHP